MYLVFLPNEKKKNYNNILGNTYDSKRFLNSKKKYFIVQQNN